MFVPWQMPLNYGRVHNVSGVEHCLRWQSELKSERVAENETRA